MPARPDVPEVLIGHETFDDAGVYQIAPDLALIQTVDFFTPVVDDPRDFGRIAAANALSDVYAMGGTPRTALNLVCWPPEGLGPDVLARILEGGTEKIHEAGCVVIGGHSIQDEELKFGYAVTGTARPDRLLTNAGARPGDALLLTKPLGTGLAATALKRGAVDEASIAPVVEAMAALNAAAAEVALAVGARAATDVTGFGLAGHAVQLADASGASLAVEAGALPLFPGVEDLAVAANVPAGGRSNRAYFGPRVGLGAGVSEKRALVAFDPQTSGGLLLAVPAAAADEALAALAERGCRGAARIGEVTERGERAVYLRGTEHHDNGGSAA